MRVARGRASENAAGGGSATRIARQSPRRLERDADVARATGPRAGARRNAETPKRPRRGFARGVCVADGRAEEREVRTRVLRVARRPRRVALDAGARTAPGPAARAEGFDDAAAAWSATAQFKERAADGKPCATTVRLVTSAAPEDTAAAALARRGRGEASAPTCRPACSSPRCKAVRRGACGPARRARWRSCTRSRGCLRRLAVIAVEDATAHPATPLLVWFMAAQSKGTCSARARCRRARRRGTRRV